MGLNLTTAGASALSAGLGFVGNLGGSVASGLFNANQARLNRKFQERMYNKQVEDNINFWKMQNEYNLPSAQLQRLQDAGLNPLLMYGEGGISGNLAQQQVQSGQAPHGSQASANFNTQIDLPNLALVKAQVRNVDADTESKLQDALLKAEETVRTSAETSRIKSETQYNIDSLRDRIESIRIQNRLNEALSHEPEWKIKEIQANIEHLDNNNQWIQQQIMSNQRLTDQQIKESDQRIENSIKETAAAVNKMNAEARKAVADAILADAMRMTEDQSRDPRVRKLREEVREAVLSGDAQEIENQLNRWIFSQRPGVGTNAYNYQKFINQWVNPITESLGKVFGGAATWSISPKKK